MYLVDGFRRRIGPGLVSLLVSLGPTVRADVGAQRPDVGAMRPAADDFEKTLRTIRDQIVAGDHARAEARALEVVEAAEREYGPEALETAAALDVLLEARMEQGARDQAALSLGERALAMKQRVLGSDHPDVAVSVTNLALLQGRMGKGAAAREGIERALGIREAVFGPDHPLVAESLTDLAILIRRMGQYKTAREHLERAWSIEQRAGEAGTLRAARTLVSLGVAHALLGDHAGARSLFERALATRERLLAPDHSGIADIIGNLAEVSRKTGDLEGARALSERALGIYESRFGPAHPAVAGAQFQMANLENQMGNHAEAERWSARSLETFETIFGPDHPQLSGPLQSLGIARYEQGDYAGARCAQERAIALIEESVGAESVQLAVPLDNLGNIMSDLGDLRTASELYERALRLRERELGPDHSSVGANLNNLAILMSQIGKVDTAVTLQRRALRILETNLGPDHADMVSARLTLGDFLYKTGQADEAREQIERAVEIADRVLPEDHPLRARALFGLGDLLVETGEYEAARRHLERAVAIYEKTVFPGHPHLTNAVIHLAVTLWFEGDAGAALEQVLRIERTARAHFQDTARSLSEEEALGYGGIRKTSLELAASLLSSPESAAMPRDATARVWDELIRSRSPVLDEMAYRRRAAAYSASGATAAAWRDLEDASRKLARLIVRGAAGEPEGEHGKAVRVAKREKEGLERALASASESYRRELSRREAGLDAVRSPLGSRKALVAYLRFGRSVAPERAAHAAKPDVPADFYLAFVLPAGGGNAVALPLAPAAQVDELIRRWRSEIGQPPRGLGRAGGRAERRVRSIGERLRQVIWDPIATRLGAAAEVFVVPDGLLHFVNLAALPAADDRYLVETGATIHYLSAERELIREKRRESGVPGLLALGGPDFDARPLPPGATEDTGGAPAAPSSGEISSGAASPPPAEARPATRRGRRAACAAFRSLRFSPLPGSRTEVEQIAEIWRARGGAGGAGAAGAEVVTLTGADARESSFEHQLPRRGVLHLATHGFFLDERCRAGAGEAEGPGQGSVAEDGRQGTPRGAGGATALETGTADGPLLLSGLALASANRRDEAGRSPYDGILTSEEIAMLDLSGIDWVVLSACDTGLGEVQRREGVLGLKRAFEIAGAGTLIMSLWPVDDRFSREWMKALYEARFDGLSTSEAVRRASSRVLDWRREAGLTTHPFYWGAFLATGDWR